MPVGLCYLTGISGFGMDSKFKKHTKTINNHPNFDKAFDELAQFLIKEYRKKKIAEQTESATQSFIDKK